MMTFTCLPIYSRRGLHVLAAALLTLASSLGRGDVASDLTNYVDSVGGAVTSTPASIYEGQSRGYINGGRLFVRMPVRNVQPMAFKAPKFTAGCGGIDVFGGSLSFITAAELSNTLKAIGNSGGSYALMLGIRTVSSQIANTMEEVFGWLKDKIGQDINSCEKAANIVGAGMSFLNNISEDVNVCIVRKMESSGMTYDKAKQACGGGGGSKDIVNDPAARKMSFIDGNLVWKILSNNQIFAGDNDMKMLAMSLTGTIVKRQVKVFGGVDVAVAGGPDSQSQTQYYPSLLLTDPGILDALLYGATITRYACTDNLSSVYGCKNITKESWTLDSNDSLVARTRAALMNIYDAIRNRTDPSAADKGFVVKTSIPTMRIVRTAALLGDNGLGIQIIDDYAEQIAIELLATYIGSIANAVSAYSYEDSLGEEGGKLRENIQMVMSELRDIRESANLTLTNSLRIAEQMQYYERILISAMPNNLMRSMTWAAGGGH